MHAISLGVVTLLALVLVTPSASAAEPFEGAWARTLKDCGNADGPTSLTVIDLKVNVDGKTTPMVERYENHCFLDNWSTVGRDTTVKATCYDFWDDYRKRANGRKSTIKLSLITKDALKLDGKSYRRCPDKRTRRRS